MPYTLIALLVCLFLTDFVNEGYKQVRAFNIITSKPEDVSNMIMDKLFRGCTVTKVTGMHSKIDKYNVLCLISKFQTNYLRRLLKEVDPEAFVYSVAVSEVIGEWAKESELPAEEKGSKPETKKITKTRSSNTRTSKQSKEDAEKNTSADN